MVDLLVAAHRDDDILGAGGLLALHPGAFVAHLGHVDLCRDGGGVELLRAASKARNVIAANVVMWGDEDYRPPDNQFDAVPLLTIIRYVERAIAQVQPDTIYTHHPHDLNVDHRITCQAVLTATRPTPGQTVKAVYGFEVASSTEWNFGSEGFKPNVFVDISQTMEKKLEALRCYQSELRDYPHPRSERAVRSRAEYWGQIAGVEYAEAFTLLREIR